MSRLDKIKEIIKENIEYAKYGLFFTRNCMGDHMCTIYNENNVVVDICYFWGYFEVFGLNSEEKKELFEYYYSQLGGY